MIAGKPHIRAHRDYGWTVYLEGSNNGCVIARRSFSDAAKCAAFWVKWRDARGAERDAILFEPAIESPAK